MCFSKGSLLRKFGNLGGGGSTLINSVSLKIFRLLIINKKKNHLKWIMTMEKCVVAVIRKPVDIWLRLVERTTGGYLNIQAAPLSTHCIFTPTRHPFSTHTSDPFYRCIQYKALLSTHCHLEFQRHHFFIWSLINFPHLELIHPGRETEILQLKFRECDEMVVSKLVVGSHSVTRANQSEDPLGLGGAWKWNQNYDFTFYILSLTVNDFFGFLGNFFGFFGDFSVMILCDFLYLSEIFLEFAFFWISRWSFGIFWWNVLDSLVTFFFISLWNFITIHRLIQSPHHCVIGLECP